MVNICTSCNGVICDTEARKECLPINEKCPGNGECLLYPFQYCQCKFFSNDIIINPIAKEIPIDKGFMFIPIKERLQDKRFSGFLGRACAEVPDVGLVLIKNIWGNDPKDVYEAEGMAAMAYPDKKVKVTWYDFNVVIQADVILKSQWSLMDNAIFCALPPSFFGWTDNSVVGGGGHFGFQHGGLNFGGSVFGGDAVKIGLITTSGKYRIRASLKTNGKIRLGFDIFGVELKYYKELNNITNPQWFIYEKNNDKLENLSPCIRNTSKDMNTTVYHAQIWRC